MIPGRSSIGLAALLVGLGLATAFLPDLASLWIWLAGLGALAMTLDAWQLRGTPTPDIERDAPSSFSLSSWVNIGLVIRNVAGRRRILIRVFDHHPDTMQARDLPQQLAIDSGRYAEIEYQVRPMHRGAFEFPGCEVRLASPLRFWWSRRRVALPGEARVYPNYSTISKLLNYEVENRLQLTGVRLSRRRGEGIEFHQLRDYRDGDSLRAIDWKATARMSRLISREYQDERDQQVIFVLDAGRRMLARDGDLSHFDQTLNAMLLVSFVALRQGDGVGVMTVGQQRTWLPPRKGIGAINGLLNHVYGIQAEPIAIDYLSAATELKLKQRRRALVIFLTNLREEDSQDLGAAVELLRRQHLVIVASLREKALDEVLDTPVHNVKSAALNAATNVYLEARNDSHQLLRAKGVFVEDCLSEELPAAVTRRYLAIKRAGLL